MWPPTSLGGGAWQIGSNGTLAVLGRSFWSRSYSDFAIRLTTCGGVGGSAATTTTLRRGGRQTHLALVLCGNGPHVDLVAGLSQELGDRRQLGNLLEVSAD